MSRNLLTDANHESFHAITTLRAGYCPVTQCLRYCVKPTSRFDSSDVWSESKGISDFECDQAVIELYGKLGAV